jgi:hypothetical protein
MREEFVRYIALLLELHRIAPHGDYTDCGKEADAVLNQMEDVSDGLTQDEVDLAKDLSAALYKVAESKS